MKSYAFSDHERISTAELDVRGRYHAILNVLRTWHARARTRRELTWLSTAQLRDIGIDPIDANLEAAKPFWRG